MRRIIQFLPGHYYHIYNRGNNKQKVFLEEKNYYFFLDRLRSYLDKESVNLCAYCLMPNHYHLIIYVSKVVDFPKLIQSFTISYVKALNRWHERVGHLFQSEFNAKQIEDNVYLANACGYIHINPVVSGLVSVPEDWKFSDYADWVSPQYTRIIGVRDHLFGYGDSYKMFVGNLLKEKKKQREIGMMLAKCNQRKISDFSLGKTSD